MSDDRERSLLALAAELGSRDEAVAAEIDRIGGLLSEADRLRARAVEVRAFLEALPGARGSLELGEREAHRLRDEAAAELAQAERHAAELGRRRRSGEEALARAESELARARDRVADVDARLERLAAERGQLLAAERERRDEAQALGTLAAELAGRVRTVPRVSDAGGADPGASLDDLVDWGARVHAALFVVRGGLELERERVVREANELGAVVLGEPVAASVGRVRELIEQTLRA